MPLRRWIPAMLVGTLMWGTIYATVGMSVIWLWLENPLVAVAALILLLALILGYTRRERRRAMPHIPPLSTKGRSPHDDQ